MGHPYSNSCQAECRGLDSAIDCTDGPCDTDDDTDDTDFDPCLCPAVYAPVCCGDNTYSSGCVAYCTDGFDSTTDVCTDGPCADDTDSDTDTDTDVVIYDCDQDNSYLRFDCPDEEGTGCSVHVELALDVCLLNFKFSRDQVYKLIRRPFKYVIEESLTDYIDFCDESDIKIEVYAVAFKDDAAEQCGKRQPVMPEDCLDAIDVCGDDRGELGITVNVEVGFYCGECTRLEAMYTALLALVNQGTFDTAFVEETLGLSLNEDGVCRDGFGGAEIDSLTMYMADESGEVIPDTEVGYSGVASKSVAVAAAAVVLAMSLF